MSERLCRFDSNIAFLSGEGRFFLKNKRYENSIKKLTKHSGPQNGRRQSIVDGERDEA